MPRITRRFEFDAGHRIVGHESKCANLHGHRYIALVTVSGELDELGRVIDFGELKTIVGGWIDANWDHNMILYREDPLLHLMRKLDADLSYDPESFIENVFRKSPYIMEVNPTAENMAKELYLRVRPLLGAKQIWLKNIELYETPNCSATFPDPPV